VLGKMIEEEQADGSKRKVFYPQGHEKVGDDVDVQGVYFSSRRETSGEPDLIRVADTAKRLQSTGYLKTISEEDLKNTDILVFRESTGDLILERRGLRDAELDRSMGLGKTGKEVYYRVMLRGPKDSQLNVGGTSRQGSWTEWATRNQLAEPFRNQASDHLKSGEYIRLVAINRATGYMGSQRIQLSDVSQTGGYLNFPVDDLQMAPPNRKVWPERSYLVEAGLTANDPDRKFIIGAEGASLTSDASSVVYTEWLDHDDRPLPEGLDAKTFGLTGRLAKVVANDTLAAVADSDLASFPIGPGRQTQVIQVRDNLTRPEHYYIHVSGRAEAGEEHFAAGGAAADATLATRPAKLTPFLTPLYDENRHWAEYNAYRNIKRDQGGNDDPGAVTPTKPLPSYAWGYRPEYQFSRYSLEMD